jgi:OmpA-OmpF porin, OOP family
MRTFPDMIRTSIPALLTMLFALAPAPAAGNDSGFFLRADVGQGASSNFNLDDRAPMLQLGAGYRWGTFGAEIGALRAGTLEREIDLRPLDGPRVETRVETEAWILGLNARHRIGERWFFSGHAGALFWDVTADNEACFLIFPPGASSAVKGFIPPTRCERSEGTRHGTDLYGGVGIGYDVTPRFSVGLGYDWFRIELQSGTRIADGVPDPDLDLRAASLATEWRF